LPQESKVSGYDPKFPFAEVELGNDGAPRLKAGKS
jgi:hypothetical protein